MISAEIIQNKIQEILGEKYAVFANDAFNRNFTNPAMTPYGARLDINQQAFEDYADKIVAVVTATPITLFSVAYRLEQLNYRIDFWVPLDYVKRDADGVLLETPKFDFFADAESLRNQLISCRSLSAEGPLTYKSFFTASEPQLISSAPERTGTYMRVVYQMSGAVSISDNALGTGSDIKIAFVAGGTEQDITNYTNLVVDSSETGNVATFEVDDISTGNAALTTLKTLAFNRYSAARRRIKIYKSGTAVSDFYATVKVQYLVTGLAAFGRYRVTLTWSEDSAVGIVLTINGTPCTVSNITRMQIGANTEINAILRQGTLPGKQEPAATGQRIDFEVEDYIYTTPDAALELFREKAFENVASPSKIYVSLNKKGELQKEFWASLDVQYVVANGYGKYVVSLTDLGG